MVGFAAHFNIHAIKIGFQNTSFYLESAIACQSEVVSPITGLVLRSLLIARVPTHC